MTDAELDARFGGLADVSPPDALATRTLALVAAERAREQTVDAERAPSGWYARVRERRWTLLAVALGLLTFNLATFDAPSVAPASDLQPKGAGDVVPLLDLRAAVKRGDSVERFAAGTRYAEGDTVIFRVYSSVATPATLTRNGAVLWSGALPAGESDLPVGYAFEAGEDAARFEVRTPAGAAATLTVAAVAP